MDRLAPLAILLAAAVDAQCTSNSAAWGTDSTSVTIADGAVESTGFCNLVINDGSQTNYLATAQLAKRTCRGTTFDSGADIDLTGCHVPAAWKADTMRCPPIGEWVETWHTTGASGAAVAKTVNCVDIDSDLYASGTATRDCTATGWTDVVSTNCVKVQCAAGGDAKVADTTPVAQSAVNCGTYDANMYPSDTTNQAKRWCFYNPGAAPAWANAFFDDVSTCTGTPTACTGSGVDLTQTGANQYTDATSGAYGERNCNAEDATLWEADGAKVKKLCTAGSYVGTVDTSACTKLSTVCPTDDVWPLTPASGTPVTITCASYDIKYASGNASRTCTAGVWGTVDVASCVLKQCSGIPTGVTMDAGFAATNVGVTASKDCNDVNALYTAGDNATADCEITAATGAAEFTNYAQDACSWSACAASGDWGQTASGATAEADCATINTNAWISGKATRACTDGAWSATIDYSACADKECAHSGGFSAESGANTDMAPGDNAVKACATYDATNYDATDAYAVKLCHAGDASTAPTLGFLDLSACVVKTSVTTKCAADGVWKETPDGATETILCETLNAELYTPAFNPLASATVGLATRACGTTSTTVWEAVNVSNCVEKQCASGDDANGYTWPATDVAAANVADVDATVDCQTYASSFASGASALRECKNVAGTPTWQAVDLQRCKCTAVDPGTGYTWPLTRFGSHAQADCGQYNPVAFKGDTNFATRECTTTGFSTVDTSSCTETATNVSCPAATGDYAQAQGYEGQTANVACNTVTSPTVIYTASGQNAVTQCAAGAWSAVADMDTSACTTLAQCLVDKPWPATDVATTATVFCNDVDVDYKQDGTLATRACAKNGAAAEWDAVSVSSCVYKGCTASSPWTAAAHGDVQTVLCTTINATAYRAGLTSRECSKGVWGAVDETNCHAVDDLSCIAHGVFPASPDSATPVTVDCGTYDADLYASGANVSRTCTKGIWGAVDVSACTDLTCAASNGLAASALGATSNTGTCATYSASTYKSGTFSATCVAGTWADYDLSGCVYVDCAASSPWQLTASGATAQVACATFDATHYASTTAMVDRACENGGWSTTIDESDCLADLASGITHCAADGAWPGTFSDESPASVSCTLMPNAVNYDSTASATRVCASGTWADPDYTACEVTCAADGVWGATKAHEADDAAECNTYDVTHYASGTEFATRTCTVSGWATPNEDACVTMATGKAKCTDSAFPHAFNGATSTLDCKTYDATYVAGTNAVKTCGSDGVFSTADASACVLEECPANANWPLTNVGATASEPCTTILPATAASGTATRACGTDKVWGTADLSACVYKNCPHSGGWIATAPGATQELECDDHDEIYYDSPTEKATRTCGDGVWSAVSTIDTAPCVTTTANFGKCPSGATGGEGFPDGFATPTADHTRLTTCAAHDSRYKTTVGQTSNLCKTDGWATANVSNCEFNDCAAVTADPGFDSTNTYTWPQTVSGATAEILCKDYDPTHYDSTTEEATRTCTDAAWGTVDYSACTDLAAGVSICPTSDDGHFPGPAWNGDVIDTVECATYNATLWVPGPETVSVTCAATTASEWGPVDESDCVKIQCAADTDKPEDFPATDIWETVEVKCAKYDEALYVEDDMMATRECRVDDSTDPPSGAWDEVDVTACVEIDPSAASHVSLLVALATALLSGLFLATA